MRRPLFTEAELAELEIFDQMIDREFERWDQLSPNQRNYLANKDKWRKTARLYQQNHRDEINARARERYREKVVQRS